MIILKYNNFIIQYFIVLRFLMLYIQLKCNRKLKIINHFSSLKYSR